MEEMKNSIVEKQEQDTINNIVEDDIVHNRPSENDELGNAIKQTASYMAFRLKLAAVSIVIIYILATLSGAI